MITIYHNPRCSKSRETLELIKAKGEQIKIVEYLKTPPTYAELKRILMKLHMRPEQILRKTELLYKEKFKKKNFTDDEWIKIMTEHPVLIERPIVVKGNKALLGRPPENVLNLL